MKRKQAVFHLGAGAVLGSIFALVGSPWWAFAGLAVLLIPSVLVVAWRVTD